MFYNIIRRLVLYYERFVMKNKINIIAFLVALTIFVTGFTAFSLRHTEKNIIPTENYSKKEINSAMNRVARHFTVNYQDCKLLKLYTNEDSERESDRLVVFADYYVGDNLNRHPSKESDTIYKRWQFEMKNICGLWIITNHGYG